MFTQGVLHAELARRVRAAATGLDGGPADGCDPAADLPGPAGLPDLAELAAAVDGAPDVVAVAVLRHFDPAVFARSALEFALGVDAGARDAWFRAFTRTLFLAGNPVNLAERFPFDHVAADGSMAWWGPVPAERATGLRRLLKLFDGVTDPNPPATLTVDVPGAGGGRAHRLHVSTAGVSTAEYLVHVNHVLAEAVLTGLVGPGDRITLRHVPRLGGAAGPYLALRVHRDNRDPARLRAYAGLSTG